MSAASEERQKDEYSVAEKVNKICAPTMSLHGKKGLPDRISKTSRTKTDKRSPTPNQSSQAYYYN